MDHARERRKPAIFDAGHQPLDGLFVRHVRERQLHGGSPRPEGFDRLEGRGLRVAPPVQHDAPRPGLAEPGRYPHADAAETAGHQIAPVATDEIALRTTAGRRGQAAQPGNPAGVAAPGDLVLPARTQDLVGQGTEARILRGIEIQEADPKLAELPRHRPPESPQHGPGQSSGLFSRNDLRPGSQEIHPEPRIPSGVVKPLHQRQGTPHELGGGRRLVGWRAAAAEPLAVQDAPDLGQLGQRTEELPPRLSRLRIGKGRRVRRPLRPRRDHALAAFFEFAGQRGGRSLGGAGPQYEQPRGGAVRRPVRVRRRLGQLQGPPLQAVEQLLRPGGGKEQRGAADGPQADRDHLPERFPLAGVQPQVRPPSAGGGVVPERRLADDPLRKSGADSEVLPSHRHPQGGGLVGFGGPDPAEHLETAFQQDGAGRFPVPGDLLRQAQRAERRARSRPQPDDPAKRSFGFETGAVQPAIELRGGRLGQPGPQHPELGCRQVLDPGVAARAHSAGGVTGPRTLPRAAAEHLELTRGPVLSASEHELEGARPAVTVAPASPIGQDERVLDPEIPYECRRRRRLDRRDRCEGFRRVQRARRHQAPEHPLTGEPGKRFGGDLERDFAARQFPARPEQFVAGVAGAVPAARCPEPLPLERIRGYRHPRPALSGVKAPERDGKTGFVGPRHGLGEGFVPRRSGPRLAGHHHRARMGGRPFGRGPAERRERAQHRPRTDLDQHPATQLAERPHPGREANRRPRLTAPVRGLHEFPGARNPTGDPRHQRCRRRGRGQFAGRLAEAVEHRVHQGAVEGLARSEAFGADPRGVKPLFESRQRTGRAAQDLVGPVVRREVQPRPLIRLPQAGERLVSRGEHGEHPPAPLPLPRQRSHHGAPAGGEAQTFLEPEDPGRRRRRDLPHAVAEHGIGFDPQALPEGNQRRLQRVERRLGPLRRVEIPRTTLPAEHRFQQRCPPFVADHPLGAIQRRPHHRLALVEIPPHCHPLAPLAREQEGHLARGRRRALHAGRFRIQSLARTGRAVGPQLFSKACRVPKHQGRALPEVAPANPRHVGRIRQPLPGGLVGTVLQPLEVAARQLLKGARLPRRERKHPHPARLGRRPGVCRPGRRHRNHGARLSFRPRVRLENGVRVGAREPERAHRRPRRPVLALGPRSRLRGHSHREPLPGDAGVGPLEVEVPRNQAVTHREQRLHHTRHSRRGLQVPDVRLHRSEEQRLLRGPALPVHGGRGVHLDRIAEFGARPVRLQVVHLRGPDLGARERFPNHPLLRRTVRHGEARARPVLVQGRPGDDPGDGVAVPLGVGKPLQHQDSASLAPDEPVRRRVEGLAPSVLREHPGFPEADVPVRAQNHVHSPAEREIHFLALEGRRRQVGRDERPGTGGVHGDGRSAQPEGEGEPAARGGETRSTGRIEARLAGQHPVVAVRQGDIDAGATPAEAARCDPGVFEGLPAGFEQQALLGVEPFRFHRGDAEERRVEAVESGQIPTPVRPLGPERPVSRTPRGHRARPRLEQRPEAAEVRGAGEAASHTDHRDPAPATRLGASATAEIGDLFRRERQRPRALRHRCRPR